MGTSHGKISPSPFEQFLEVKRNRAKSMKYIPGKASDFYFICQEGKTDGVRQILEDENSPSIEELNQLQPNGSTPLHAATYYNHVEIVKLLLEHKCPRTTLNRYGNTAYEEAQTIEMKRLFMRSDSTARFHETNTAETISVFLPKEDIENVNTSQTVNYVHLFETESEVFEYSLNQQTTAMWLSFYNWFAHTFRTFLERDDVNVNTFDLNNHPDFKLFLQRTLSDPEKYTLTMESVKKAKRRNSIEPLIELYTSEDAGFYGPFNQALVQTESHAPINSHLCERFIIEFYLHRHELKPRAFTGTTYRGATISNEALNIYRQAMESNPPGILGFKAFTSTSRDIFVALDFALRRTLNEDQKYVLFIFEIPKASSTIFGLDDVSIYHNEQEVLILPGNLFIVTDIKEQEHPPITKIYLRHWKIPISFWTKIKQTIRAGKKSVS